jgi:hypothetical protein
VREVRPQSNRTVGSIIESNVHLLPVWVRGNPEGGDSLSSEKTAEEIQRLTDIEFIELNSEPCVTARMKFSMPNRETFKIPAVSDLLAHYLDDAFILFNREWEERESIICDPFARNSQWGTHRNDLNPETLAHHHMKADDYLEMMIEKKGEGWADAVLLDPPYSPRQVKECYSGLGLDVTSEDTRTSQTMSKVRELAARTVRHGGLIISFGWDANGCGKKNGMVVTHQFTLPHGSVLRATQIILERKVVA